MKKLLPVILLVFTSQLLNAQCGIVGIIGEVTDWSADLVMTNDLNDLNKYSFELNLLASDDTSDPADGIVELKFRQNLDWAVNWGAADFPSGTATTGGDNIPVPVGNYIVEFDCSTGAYSFTSLTCGKVGLVGEMTGWSADPDIAMTRDASNPEMWTGFIALLAADDTDASGFVDLKFRENSDWTVNWGAMDFPTGTGTPGGDNIPVPVGSYDVTFNCGTGEYTFTQVPGLVGVVGEFTEWGGAPDATMTRDGNDWSTIITVNESHDGDMNGTVEVKFRENSDWGTNWGGPSDCGTAVLNGDNVSLPYGSYAVSFNDQTLEYCFTATCGQVSMIGAFINWGADVNMQRSDADPNVWTTTRNFYADAEMKFRENADWAVNWGDASFPSGTATLGGANIPLTAGEYLITFNCSTGEYSFTASSALPCGEIGIIGTFNDFGANDPATDPATDVWMERDPVTLSDFTLFYNFDATTQFYFREDADITFMNVWGGTNFPLGAGVMDAATQLTVPGGKYNINFNCITGVYDFERLGNSATAPKVFNINVDGVTDEADWSIDRGILNELEGTIGMDEGAQFGITYNDEFIFVGVNVTDSEIVAADDGDIVSIYIDGDKSGGDYTNADIAVSLATSVTANLINGNGNAYEVGGIATTADGYSIELAVSWDSLGIDPSAIGGFGFDVIVQDVDGMDTTRYSWNGTLDNNMNTSGLGDVNLGGLECGQISMYGDNIGDVGLNTLSATPTEYVATFDFSAAEDIVFRKDNSDVVTWGGGALPSGTATLGGDVINVAPGRYMVSFDCSTLDYTFSDATAGDCVAISDNTTQAVAIDGDLAEYTLDQVMDLVVDGMDENNTITWGTRWDNDNLYLAAQVTDATVLSAGSVNPWEQDAVEIYIDGNHDADGDYDSDKDVQLIIYDDGAGVTQIWNNGGPAVDVEASFALTGTGYNVEVKFPFSNIGFVPGDGRTIGFTVGTNDADNTVGTRENQIAWCGTGSNFNNTTDFGDLQFTGGMMDANENIYVNNEVLVYPNPASSIITIQTLSDVFDSNTNVRMFDLLGRTVMTQKVDLSSSNVQLNVENIPAGIFYLELLSSDGNIAIKKLVIE